MVIIFNYLAYWAKALFKEAMVSPFYFIKDTIVANIVLFRFGKFFLLEVFIHICLP